LGKEHPDTATSYNNLAICYYHLFEYEKAYESLNTAIQIRLKIFDSNDKTLVSAKKNLKEIEKHISQRKKEGYFSFLLKIFTSNS
jgi:tetratricopeptide (TPR) repeat protein